jgi:hypothetical protein
MQAIVDAYKGEPGNPQYACKVWALISSKLFYQILCEGIFVKKWMWFAGIPHFCRFHGMFCVQRGFISMCFL